ncbi:uncharacterized protein LOC144705768 [Wolffia australiana]
MRSAQRKSGGGGRSGWDVRPNPIASPSRSAWSNHGGRDSRRNPRPLPSISLRRSASLERERYDDLHVSADAPRRRLSPEPWTGSGALTYGRRHLAGFDEGYDTPEVQISARARTGRPAAIDDLPLHRSIPVNGATIGELKSSSSAGIDEHGRLGLNSSYLADGGYRRKSLHREQPSSMDPGLEDPRYQRYSRTAGYEERKAAGIYTGEGSLYPLSSTGLPEPEPRYAARAEVGRSSGYRSFRDEAPQPGRYSWRDGLEAKARDEPQGRRVSEFDWRRRGDDVGEDLQYSDGFYSPARRAVGEMVGEPRTYRYLEEDTIPSYSSFRGAKPSLGDEVLALDSDFRYGREGIAGYRDPGRSSLERYAGVGRRNLSPPQMMGTGMENLNDSGIGPARDRVIQDEIAVLRETRNARAIEMDDEDQRWADRGRMIRGGSPPTRPARFDYSRLSGLKRRISDSGDFSAADPSFRPLSKGNELKRRLRAASPGWFPTNRGPNHDEDYDGYDDNRQLRLLRRKGVEDPRIAKELDERDQPKIDPPEGSEEFKQQLHKAFLRFVKLLHEDPTQRKKYLRGGKAPQSFLCSVCDRQSKEFGDVHRLAMHAYHSLKAGLKTEHRGLHKALCVLMGWDWTLPPDTSRRYTMKPGLESQALKGDLIIWPPLVIIRRLSTIKKPTADKKPNTSVVEAALKGMKVEMSKVKISRGRVGEGSTVLVKFMPTLSGLREADRLHGLLLERKKGKKELEAAAAKKDSGGGEVLEAAESLYGHMGTVEDLDMLDSETKRRCAIKSKKEIEDMVDAPIEAIKS